MNRRELRENIFLLLFRYEFHDAEGLIEQKKLFFEELTASSVDEKAIESHSYIREKYHAIVEKINQIDEAIDEVAKGWKKERMGKVDLTLLRLAVYEMKYEEDIPTGVAINEAVEIAKKYGGDDTPAFINGILAKLV